MAFLIVAQAIGAYQTIPIRPGGLARSPCFSEACSHARRGGGPADGEFAELAEGYAKSNAFSVRNHLAMDRTWK